MLKIAGWVSQITHLLMTNIRHSIQCIHDRIDKWENGRYTIHVFLTFEQLYCFIQGGQKYTPSWVKVKYGAWYLSPKAWKSRPKDEPLQDPKEQQDKTLSEAKKKSQKLVCFPRTLYSLLYSRICSMLHHKHWYKCLPNKWNQ